MDFKVNGNKVKTPTTYDIDFNPISEGERRLDGTMILEGVSGKLTVTLNYNTITDDELIGVIGCTWDVFMSSKKITQEIEFPYFGGKQKKIKTYFAPTKVTRDKEALLSGRWKNFTMKFIEL